MPTRAAKWPAGTPCWADLAVPDVAEATAFYGPVIGWTFQDSGDDYGGYHMAMVGERAAAGIGQAQHDQQVAWTVYLASDDVDGTAKLVTDHDGSVLVEPFDVPQTGRMCVASDPTGGVFGIWQANPMIGIQVYNEPGALSWEDARLTDPERGKRFYTALFGYDYTPIPDAPDDYGVFGFDSDAPLGGMGGLMDAPEGTPSHWLPYFSVPSVDDAVAAARSGGGRVLSDPVDTPYGRMATVRDPFGGVFAVHQDLGG